MPSDADNPTPSPIDRQLAEALHHVFGFDSFRPNQEAIVRAILAGRDVLAVMPTGGGKSLCYQLPARLLEGVCVVVSPLIALMKDQVDAACQAGLAAAYLNSSQSPAERAAVRDALDADELDLLYVSPERFAMEGFADQLARVRLSFFAIDEAHCISEWGHEFRPDYLNLSALVRRYTGVPVAAFTATATLRVQEDTIDRLALREAHVVRASFDRSNLHYQVLPKSDLNKQLLTFLRGRAGESGIIYRTTRKDVESTAAHLAAGGVNARPYHAGLPDAQRQAAQEAFSRDETQVIVATIAFGMGIDKSNVRFVVHGDLPKSVEGYYQETGRAGRDGDPAQCVLYYSPGDAPRLRYFIDQLDNDTARQAAEDRLRRMEQYATALVCRRQRLLEYFGEAYPHENCRTCDVCCGDVERVDATTEAQMFLSAAVRTGERFGRGHVIDVVTGSDTERVRQLGHDGLKTYGVGGEKPKRYWRELADHLLNDGCLEHDPQSRLPVLKLTERGREVLFGRRRFSARKHAAPAGRKARPQTAGLTGPADVALFDRLRELRRRLAGEQGIPPYMVFSDRSLREMASRRPGSLDELAEVHGVGDAKLGRYGQTFLDAIAAGEPAATTGASGGDPAGDPAEALLRGLGRGLSLPSACRDLGLTEGRAVKILAQALQAGREVPLGNLLPARLRKAVAERLAGKRRPSLRAVTEVAGEMGEPVSPGQVKLLRAWLVRQGD